MTAPEVAPIGWLAPPIRGAWAAGAIAATIYLALMPRALVNADEYFYAGQAYSIAHGRLVPALGDPLPVVAGAESAAVKYPPGWPAMLAIPRAVSFQAMFLVALAVHVLGGLAFGRVLVRRGLPSWLAAVYLFHPSLWIYARTLLSDAPAAALVVVAIDAWEGRRAPVAGLALGWALLVRLGSAFAILGFALAVLPEVRRRRGDIVWVAAGVFAGLVAYMATNQVLAGDPLSSAYTRANAMMLDGRMAANHAVLQLGGLALLPPFSAAWALMRWRKVDRWALGSLPVLAFGIVYAYHDASASMVETLVGGQRLVLAAHVFLMVATARAWGSARVIRRDRVLAVTGALGLLGALALRRIEDRYAPAVDHVRACRPARIAYDMNAARIAAAVSARGYVVYRGGVPPPADVLVVARRMPTNRPNAFAGTWDYPGLEALRDRCRPAGEFEIYDFSGGCPSSGTPCP